MDEREHEAFCSWVSARSPSLLRTAYLLTGSRVDAEDLLQTTLAKTYLSWGRIREREAVDGYARRVMVNTQTSLWRRRRVAEDVTDEPPEPRPRGGPRDAMAELDLRHALWQALSRLPRRQRATLVLRYYEDLSETDTAKVLGCSVGTVKSTSSRALARLRQDTDLRDGPVAAPGPTHDTGHTHDTDPTHVPGATHDTGEGALA